MRVALEAENVTREAETPSCTAKKDAATVMAEVVMAMETLLMVALEAVMNVPPRNDEVPDTETADD